MEGELSLVCVGESDEEEEEGGRDEGRRRRRREVCSRCDRPAGNACLCDALPAKPVRLAGGRVLILQHPNERKRKLATVPLLTKALADCEVLVGRSFSASAFPSLAEAARDAAEGKTDLFVLYPGQQARSLATVVKESGRRRRRPWVLVAIDGTWQQAKEMFKCNRHRILPEGAPCAHRVSLDVGSGGGGCALPLRTEPEEGCATTLEAVAAALGVLEGSEGLERQLLAPLAKLVALQGSFSPGVAMRLQGKATYTASRRSRLFRGD